MRTASLFVDPSPGWASSLDLVPGAHVITIMSEEDCFGGRAAGLELRDTLLVLSYGPKCRFAFLWRAPMKGTTLDQVVRTGTGGINIDSCRVGTGEDKGVWPITHRTDHRVNGRSDETIETDLTVGRWPPNVLLVHGPKCRNIGTIRVKGSATSKTFHEAYEGHSNTGFIRGWSHPGNQHADAAGLETVSAWECSPGCPALLLDCQSGQRPSTLTCRADPKQIHENPGDNHGSSLFGGGNSRVYADQGGASRFFPQFRNDEEMYAWINQLLHTKGKS